MHLKRRFNSTYRDYPAYRTGDPVGILTGQEEPELKKWLGVIDRNAARQVAGAREVALDFEAYSLGLLDPTIWISKDVIVVGCEIPEGVLAVTDGGHPLLKKRKQPPKIE